MIAKVFRRAVLCAAGCAGFCAAAYAAPTVVVPQPVQYTQPLIDGAAQFGIVGFTKEIPNAVQPGFTYTPIAAPDGDTTVDWYDVTMRQIVHNAAGLVDNGTAGNPALPGFKAWAYGATAGTSTYPGMTISAQRGRPAKVIWRNALPTPHFLPVDPTIMCGPAGTMVCPDNRAIVHVHGSHGYDHSDGLPEQWFTPPPAGSPADAYPANFGTQWQPHETFGKAGAAVSPYTFVYPNDQEAATIWYHDHATGVTRLNAYAGLAGFFLVHDANEAALQTTNVLPSYPYENAIAFQDKMFWAVPGAPNPVKPYHVLGSMAFPDAAMAGGAIGQPSITAEMFGNTWLGNGVAWPKMTVEPRKYRLRLLNGGDSRTMIIKFTQTALPAPAKGGAWNSPTFVPFWIIGNEQGFLDKPLQVTSLVMMPGMRYDIVVDFTGLAAASNVYMINVGPDAPYGGTPPISPTDPLYPMADPASTGQLMMFNVGLALGAETTRLGLPAQPNAKLAATSVLRDPLKGTPALGAVPAPGTAVVTRKVYLKEASDAFGRLMLTINMKGLFDAISEVPPLGSTEVWEVADITPDAHPIHLHLVKFRLIDREPIAQLNSGTAGSPLAPYPAVLPILPKATPQTWVYAGAGPATATAPAPEETGWLDTFTAVPGTLARLQATFDIPGLYVYHCHILSHEEYDMMREFTVTTPGTGVAVKSTSTTQLAGARTPVTFFASGLTGNPLYPTSLGYEFQFWIKEPVLGWKVLQSWSTACNYTWTPAATASGTYYFQVDVRTPGTLAKSASKVVAYSVTGAVPTALTLTPLAGSQPAAATQTPVTFTAAATTGGAAGTYEYRFWLKDPVTGWSIVKPYSTVATWTWTPPPNKGACYFIQADARAVGSIAKADKSVVTRYTVLPTAVALAANKTSPQPAATVGSVIFTATPTPAAGTYEYQFWVRSSTGTWGVPLQAYGAANTFTWTPAKTPGLYYIEVDVRTKGSTAVREAAKVMSFQLN